MVYQPFWPVGAAGSQTPVTVGGSTSLTPSPWKVSESRVTPPLDVTYSVPVPAGGSGSAVSTVCQPTPAGTATEANGAAVGLSQRSASVPAPEARVCTPVMFARLTGS